MQLHFAKRITPLWFTWLAACGGGGGGASTPATFTVGGTVTGLNGTGLVLQNNGGTALGIPASGAFTFPDRLTSGANYFVNVTTQPTSPAQNCVVVNGFGIVAGAKVTNVIIACNSLHFTTLVNQPPAPGYLALLLTDGRVMMQSINDAGVFYSLTPAANGSYLNGTWRRLSSPPTGYEPYAGSQAVLADGRVLFVGGEYNQNQYVLPFAPSGLTNMSAVYDPVTDRWTMIAPPSGVAYIGDSPSVVLPDGSFMFGTKLARAMWRLDPVNLTWSSIPATGKADDFAEEGWTLLPNGNLFTIDVGVPPHAEHYDPVAAQWYSDAATPLDLTSPSGTPGGLTFGPAPIQVVGGLSYGPGPMGTYFPPGEIGPALLLPDGTVFATGAISSATSGGHTVIYAPGALPTDAGSFKAGPDFAVSDDASDSSAALLPSGHVLIAANSGRFYEYDGNAMPITGALPNDAGTIAYFVLPLPSGEVLITGDVTQIYSEAGSANPAWAPTIATAPSSVTRGSSYTLSGTQFNGLSQAAAVGDEFNAATNYPLVRIRNIASGHMVYARTHDHSSMGVATGSTLVSTTFDVQAATETGQSSLVVVANGIASAPVTVLVN